jgi:GNAT superfamily N-acetyltransferase
MEPMEELRAQFDREMRIDPPLYPGARSERVGPIVRVLGAENYVIYSDLDEGNAARVVAEQAQFFRRLGADVEWKVLGHDGPARLEQILAAEGFVPDAPETLVVYDLAKGAPGAPPGPEVQIRQVIDDRGLRDAAAANEAAFGPEGRWPIEQWRAVLEDPTQTLWVAYVRQAPVASGRLELPPARSFAGMYGGGTAPAHRRRGIYRALVAARAALALERGYRYLTVDARETSRPILERLGFVPLTTTRPWVLHAVAASRSD